MPLLLETIKIQDGHPKALDWHAARLNATRRHLFNQSTPLDLQAALLDSPQSGTYRARVLYDHNIQSVTYIPYQPPHYHCFKIIENSNLHYPYKYQDRTALNRLYERRGLADEIIIFKQGLATDITIANLAIWLNNQWVTPEKPLLKGTVRERLLAQHQLITGNITIDDLLNSPKLAMMNALLEFHIIEHPQFILDSPS